MTLTPKAIRADIVTRLKTVRDDDSFPTMAEDRVESTRQINYEREEMPAITVMTTGGTDGEFTLQGFMAGRHTEKMVIVGEVMADTPEDAADMVDDFEDQILDCLLGDVDFVKSLPVQSVTTTKKVDSSTGNVFGAVVIVLDFNYSKTFEKTSSGNPTNLKSIYVDTKPTKPDGADVSVRRILTEE